MTAKRTKKVHSIFDANTIFYAFERGDYKRCITLAMNALYDSGFPQLDDSLVDQVFLSLIKSYIIIGCNEDALLQIKLAIAVGMNNEELAVFGMECLQRLGRLDTHRYFNYCNLDFINDQSDELEDDDSDDNDGDNNDNDDDDDDDASKEFSQELAWRKTEMYAAMMDIFNDENHVEIEHEFLSPVDRADTLKRMLSTYEHLIVHKNHAKAKSLVNKMFAKYGNNAKMLEKIIATNSAYNYEDDNYEYAKILMTQNPLSALGLYAYLLLTREKQSQADWALIQERIESYHADNAKNIADIAIALIAEERCDLVQVILDNNIALSEQAEYLFVQSYLLYKKGDNSGAARLLKRMGTMFGRRSFAREYLLALRQDKLDIADIIDIPNCILAEYTESMESEISQGKAAFSSQLLENTDLRHKFCILMMRSDVANCKRLLKHINKRALESLIWDIQMLILDDEKVSAEVKSLLLHTLMCNFNNMYVYVSTYDCIEIVDFSKIEEQNEQYPLVIRHASKMAVSKIYFSEVTMLTRVENATKLVSQFYVNNPEYKDKKILAELILIECWYYEINYEIDKIVTATKINKDKFVKYYDAYIKYCKDCRHYCSLTSDYYNYSTSMGLEEMLGNMSNKIDTILGGDTDRMSLLESIVNKNNSQGNNGDEQQPQIDRGQVVIDAFAGDEKAKAQLMLEKLMEGDYSGLDIKASLGKDGKKRRATIVPFTPRQSKDDSKIDDEEDSDE